jgi:hypothetical protein
MKFKMNKKGNSGIYIKPENRGKFTATKKATGKTTEELTHSKNPVTKKRAIFAQNAAKWKHEDGSKGVRSFPDLNKDGKVSRADVLVGRGVVAKPDALKTKSPIKVSPAGEKLKMAEKLYKDNPSKTYADAVERAKSNVKKENMLDKKMCGSKGMKYAEGTKSIKFKKKEMIKRADGSVSQRGLWDNIRANKGSGKKPTPEMLKQEKKIKAGK